MSPTNVLFICSDQHARNALGCYGHPLVRTPQPGRARLTPAPASPPPTRARPICVPARAAIATGRHVHQCRAWSSAEPYDGSIEGWGHRLIEAGRRVVSVGKLHYRSNEDPNGFDTEILPMHVHAGVGWTTALLRDTQPMGSSADYARDIGWGESAYTRYDRAIGDAACRWLREEAPDDPARPWVLFVSFVSPHNPMIAPPEYESWYPRERIGMPRAYRREERHRHPVPAGVERCMDHDTYVEDDDHVRAIRASYYGLCSFMDAEVGEGAGSPRRLRAARAHPHPLHQRPRGNARPPRLLGQERHVRGLGRDPDDRRRAGHPRGSGGEHARLPRRLPPHDPGGGRVGALRRGRDAPRRVADRDRERHGLPRAPCSRSTTTGAR